MPCIDHTAKTGQGLADDILTLLEQIAEVQAKIDGANTQPLQGDVSPEPPTSTALTDAQREHVKRLCQRYGIGVYQESNGPMYISHPSLGDNTLQAKDEAELYVIVNDLAHKEQEKQA